MCAHYFDESEVEQVNENHYHLRSFYGAARALGIVFLQRVYVLKRFKPSLMTAGLAIALGVSVSAHAAEEAQEIQLGTVSVSAEKEDADQSVAYGSRTVNLAGSATPVAETPRSVNVVEREQIEKRGSQSIQDTLTYAPGVQAAPFGFDSRLDSARIRGVSPLKYKDGFQSLFGFYNNARTDIYTIDSVEVIKGPASVLYGQGALGGVVNVRSKLPEDTAMQEVELQYGTFDRKQLGVDSTGPLNESGSLLYRVVGVYRESDTQVDHVNDDAAIIMPSVTWAPTEATTFTVLGNYQDNNGGQSLQFLPNEGTLLPGQHIDSSTFIGEPDWDRYDTRRRSLATFFEHELNDGVTINFDSRYTEGASTYRSHWVAYDGADPTIAADGTVNRTIYDAPATSEAFTSKLAFKADVETAWATHFTQFGIDYIDATTDTDTFYGFASGGRINIYNPVYGNLAPRGAIVDSPADVVTQIGVFARDRIAMEDWTISLGVRNDQVEESTKGTLTTNAVTTNDESATTFDVAVMYHFDSGVSPYMSYAESFAPTGKDPVTNEQLKPTEGAQKEVGIKYQPKGKDALYTLAYFEVVEDNRVNGSTSVGQSVQQGKAEIKGFEVEVQKRWEEFKLEAGYSKLEALNKDQSPAVHIAAIADEQFSAWLDYEPLDSPFIVGAGVRHVGENWDGTDTLKTDPYTLYDAMLGYDIENWEFRLNGKNLADKEFVATTQGGRSYYGERRTVVLTARTQF
ncbi:outer membrane protein [gamma proteobacterium HTCC5015]|nr:outer membrane protein [gamma proteobacterium HTCC5015]